MNRLQLSHMNKMLAEARQPQIGDLELLATAYEHDGVLIDLYGNRDDGQIEVEDVALTGDQRSLGQWLTAVQLEQMSDWCERQAVRKRIDIAYDRAADRAQERDEMRAELESV